MRLTEQIDGLNTSSNTIMVFGIYIGFRFTLVKTIFYLLFFIFFSGREFSKVQMPGWGGGDKGILKLRIDRCISYPQQTSRNHT